PQAPGESRGGRRRQARQGPAPGGRKGFIDILHRNINRRFNAFFAKKGHLKKGTRQRQMHLENIFHALAAYDAERPVGPVILLLVIKK
ncbi:hypothetical protein ACQUHV_29175, partial [Pseudomonas aeruginosa]|uniref:hypothetical protein n=1 Tax=Pseudomonas aeruginosa TaxID=287 RepID=UPI003FCF0E8E